MLWYHIIVKLNYHFMLCLFSVVDDIQNIYQVKTL